MNALRALFSGRELRFMTIGAAMLVALFVVSGSAFAVESATLDWSDDITTAVAGITAGVAASIGAVFLIAALVKVTKATARIALKAIGFIK